MTFNVSIHLQSDVHQRFTGMVPTMYMCVHCTSECNVLICLDCFVYCTHYLHVVSVPSLAIFQYH